MDERISNKNAAVIKLVIAAIVLVMLIAVFGYLMIRYSYGDDFNLIFSMGSGIYSQPETYTVGSTEYSALEVKNVDVSWIAGSVKIIVSDSYETVRIQENGHGDDNDQMMRSRIEGGTLEIKYVKSGLRFTSAPKKDLVIYIPVELSGRLGHVDVDTASAKVTVEGAGVTSTIILDRLTIEGASADVYLKNVKIKHAEIKGASSTLDILGEAEKLVIEGVSGNITVKGSVRYLDVEAVSSEVTLDLSSTPSEINVETVSGNIDIFLIDGNDGFVADLDSVSGHIKLNGDRKGDHISYGNQIGDFDFDTVSGNVNIFVQ